MSTFSKRLWRRDDDADGFTLIEVVIALVIISIVSLAFIPLIAISVRATQLAKLNTTAKSLNQLRVDAMRNLAFHVDVQNGSYVDLLDYYYHDLNTSPTALPYSISGDPVANCTVTGQWVNTGTPPAGAPPLPYYQTTFSPVCGFAAPAGQSIPSSTGFVQVVYAQFLTGAQPIPAVVPASTLTGMTYNSQVSGHDAPPAMALGVTVITSWSEYGQTHTYRTYTEVANDGNDSPQISSSASANGILIDSHAEDQSIVQAGGGQVQINGSSSNLSSVNVHALGAFAKQAGGQTILGSERTLAAPPNPAGDNNTQYGTAQQLGTTGCGSGGWAQFGLTSTQNTNATTLYGLPQAPVMGLGLITAQLTANGNSCSGLAFSNQLDNTVATDPLLQLNSTFAMVQVADMTGTGNGVLSGNAAVNATGAVGVTGSITANASIVGTTFTAIFPGLGFVPTNGSASGLKTCGSGTQPCGTGLVNVFLSSASLQCQSGTSATASYAGYVTYYTQTGWHSVTINWSGATGADPLAAIDLSQVVTVTPGGATVHLSDYISSWNTTRSLTTAQGGSTGNEVTIPAAVAITTAPTRANDNGSQIGVRIGQLSCSAVDNR